MPRLQGDTSTSRRWLIAAAVFLAVVVVLWLVFGRSRENSEAPAAPAATPTQAPAADTAETGATSNPTTSATATSTPAGSAAEGGSKGNAPDPTASGTSGGKGTPPPVTVAVPRRTGAPISNNNAKGSTPGERSTARPVATPVATLAQPGAAATPFGVPGFGGGNSTTATPTGRAESVAPATAPTAALPPPTPRGY